MPSWRNPKKDLGPLPESNQGSFVYQGNVCFSQDCFCPFDNADQHWAEAR